MTDTEYADWRGGAVSGYAHEFVDSGILAAEAARERAENDFREILPDGLATENHLLWTARVEAEPAPIGTIWVNARAGASATPLVRLRARRPRRLPAARLRPSDHGDRHAAVPGSGIATMGLNVFGHNVTARRLYERLGFRVATTSMITDL